MTLGGLPQSMLASAQSSRFCWVKLMLAALEMWPPWHRLGAGNHAKQQAAGDENSLNENSLMGRPRIGFAWGLKGVGR